jgi:hypothetical protein
MEISRRNRKRQKDFNGLGVGINFCGTDHYDKDPHLFFKAWTKTGIMSVKTATCSRCV